MLSSDARSPEAAQGGSESEVTLEEAPPALSFPPVGDFPLEQSCDEFDQMIKVDGQLVHTDAVVTFHHFMIVRDRLYRVSRDTQGKKCASCSSQKAVGEMVFCYDLP